MGTSVDSRNRVIRGVDTLDRSVVSNISGRGGPLLRIDPWYKENDPRLPRIILRYPKSRGDGHMYLGNAGGKRGLADPGYWDTSDSYSSVR